VLVQSSCPEEPAIRKAAEHDYLGFTRGELQHRQELRVPPFVHLVRLIVRGPEEPAVRDHILTIAGLLKAALSADGPVRLLGPAPCPVARLNKQYRYHLQLSAPEAVQLRDLWRQVASQIPHSRDIEFAVDVDPINLR
jgi:primosomal protein N' (replication factor Y)